ncbi:MAG: type II toxin-antitoxin system VapC family toxin [Alphaproteobacteria bacterium]
MIIVDTSALVAILLGEPMAQALSDCLGAADARLISAANVLELGTVLAGRGTLGGASPQPAHVVAGVDRLLIAAAIDIAPVTADLTREALRARFAYGRGFGTRTGLNFGDCFAYALAKTHKAPLLFVGDDFSHTDVAVPPDFRSDRA